MFVVLFYLFSFGKMFWNYVLCPVEPKPILVEPFHHGIAEIGLKSFSDLFCKLWPSLQFDHNSNCKPWTLTYLDLITIILFVYWIMWWTWTTNPFVLLLSMFVLMFVCFFACCIVIYCDLFVLFRVNGVLQVALKSECEQRQVFSQRQVILQHKWPTILLYCIVDYCSLACMVGCLY